MAIRDLKLTLNLDTGQFTASVRNADGEMKKFKAGLSDMGGVMKTLSKDVKDVGKAVKDTAEASKVAEAATIRVTQSIRNQANALDASKQALLLNKAETLGLRGEMENLLEAVYASNTAQMEATTLLREFSAEQARAAAADAALQAEKNALVESLAREVELLKFGADALLMEKAATLGVGDAVHALLLEKAELIAQREADAEATRMEAEANSKAAVEIERAAAAQRKAAEEASRRKSPEQVLREELTRQVQVMREQIIYQKGGKAALAEYRAETISATASLRPLIAEIKMLEAEMTKFSHSAHGGTGAVVELNRIMHEATRGAFAQMTGSITILLNKLGAAGGLTLGIGVAIGVLHGMISPLLEGAKAMEEMTKKSQELGISLHDLQDYSVLADITGVDKNKLTAGAGRLDATFARARSGNKQARGAFETVGIDPSKDYTNEQMLAKIADTFSKMDDGATKASLAFKLFGRAGIELIPILDQGAEGLKRASELADEYGIHNQGAIDAAKQLTEAQRENKVAMEGLSAVLIQALGPVLTDIISSMNGMIKAFVESYKKGGEAKEWVDTLVNSIRLLVAFAIELGAQFYGSFKIIDGILYDIQSSFLDVWSSITFVVAFAWESVVKFIDTLYKLNNFDLKGALANIDDFFSDVSKKAHKAADDSYNGAVEANARARKDIAAANAAFAAGDQAASALLSGKPLKSYAPLTIPKGSGDTSGIGSYGKEDPAQKALASLQEEAKKQHEGLSLAEQDFKDIAAGADQAATAVNHYKASLMKEVDKAGGLGNSAVKKAYDDAVAAFEKRTDDEAANKALVDLKQKAEDAAVKTKELWDQYNSGATRAKTASEALTVEIDKRRRLQTTDAGRNLVDSIGKSLIGASDSGETVSALMKMNEQTKKINEGLMTDSFAKARAITQDEIRQAYERIKWNTLTAEESKKAYADYQAFVKAENDKLAAESPFGKLAHDWQDAMANMTQASAGWATSFVQDVAAGKLNFKNFAASIVADISQIIVKALFARYVINPLLDSFGLSGGGGGGSFPSFNSDTGGFDVGTFHSGGIVGMEPPGTRQVTSDTFLGAMRYHTGGIAGLMPGEVPAILQKNEGVFTQDQMKALSKGSGSGGSHAPPVTINLNNQSGVSLDADHGGTSFDGEKYILDVVVSNLSRPGTFRNAVKNSQ